MKNITVVELSKKMGMKFRDLGDLLKVTIVLIGPNDVIYGMTVSGFQMYQNTDHLIKLYMHTGENLELISNSEDEGSHWKFSIPDVRHVGGFNSTVIEDKDVDFYF